MTLTVVTPATRDCAREPLIALEIERAHDRRDTEDYCATLPPKPTPREPFYRSLRKYQRRYK